jgi:hypothetical protein
MNAREKEKESMSRNFGHGGIDFSSKWQIGRHRFSAI